MSAINFSAKHKHNKTIKFIALITLFIFCVIIAYLWLINVWQVERFQQALLTNKRVESSKQEPKKSLSLAALNIPTAANALTLEQIALPKAPALISPEPKALPSKTSISRKAVVKTNTVKTKKITKKNKQEKKTLKVNSVKSKQVAKSNNKKSTHQVYQQLFSDQSLSIELAWPNNSSQRETLFTYLYQCVGMKFGVLYKQSVTLAPQRNHFIVNAQAQYSDWLRVAQGQLAKQEQLWVQEYNLVGTAVRLLPRKVDWQLAQFITQQLQGKHLESLRANYKLSPRGLLLDNIYLNGKAIKNQWQLTQDSC